jgi:hypothetical protein
VTFRREDIQMLVLMHTGPHTRHLVSTYPTILYLKEPLFPTHDKEHSNVRGTAITQFASRLPSFTYIAIGKPAAHTVTISCLRSKAFSS